MQKLPLVVIGIFLIAILCAGCTDSSSTVVDSKPVPTVVHTVKATIKPTVTPNQDFTLVESHVETGEYGSRYVVGTIKSNVNKQFSYVQVTINEYDASGSQVGSTFANVNNLEPLGTWKFKAPILYKEATDFKVMTVTSL